MRTSLFFLSLVFFAMGLLGSPGCGGRREATVAPRSADEIERYKAEVYGAEEEDAAAQEE